MPMLRRTTSVPCAIVAASAAVGRYSSAHTVPQAVSLGLLPGTFSFTFVT